MGWKNYYSMGLQVPGYSKHKIHTKRWGDIYIGATTSDLQVTAKALANDSPAKRFYGVAFGKDGGVIESMHDPLPQTVTDDSAVRDDLTKALATRPDAVIARWFGDKADHANDFGYVAYFDKQDAAWPNPINEFGSRILTAPVIVPVKSEAAPKQEVPPASHGVAKAGLAIAGALGVIALMAKH